MDACPFIASLTATWSFSAERGHGARKPSKALVLDRGPTRVRVVVGERPKGVRDGVWRLDRGANRVAHDRMADALLRLHDAGADDGTPLRDLLLGTGARSGGLRRRPSEASVDAFVACAMTRQAPLTPLNPLLLRRPCSKRLILIQGPPGTGKTHTAVHLLAQRWRRKAGAQSLPPPNPTWPWTTCWKACSTSGVNAVRIGQPVKVRASLREATLDARLEHHPLQEDLAALRDEHDTAQTRAVRV